MNIKKVSDLVKELNLNNQELIEKAIEDLLYIDNKSINDVKLTQTTIRELKESFDIFESSRHIRKAAIFGSARSKPDHPNYIMAEKVAKQLKEINFMTITGAGLGIMEAGNKGAGKTHSFGLNIQLPFEQDANGFIANDPKLVNYKYFYTRKLAFLKESHATVCFPGGFGTHDEAFEALTLIQTGKCAPRPVVMISHPGSDYWEEWKEYIERQLLKKEYISKEDMEIFDTTKSINNCISIIQNFYLNYHSIRYIKDLAIIRMKKRLSSRCLEKIKSEFSDIVTAPEFKQGDSDIVMEDSSQLKEYQRLVFAFNKTSYGRLYSLIKAINHDM